MRSDSRTRATALAALSAVLLSGGAGARANGAAPSASDLRVLLEAYAHAIEANNGGLAMSYVHSHSPWRSRMEASLRAQLNDYFERARTLSVEVVRHPREGVARVEQEFVRVTGMKFMRGTRSWIVRFRLDREVWRIWQIEELLQPHWGGEA